MDCLFCQIIEGESPSRTVYDDHVVKVIMDIYPKSNGHLLILPKKHTEDFLTIDYNTLCHIYEVAKKMKELLYTKLGACGMNLTINYGEVQLVKHFHLHIVPVYENKPPLRELDEIFKKLSN